MPNGSHIGCQMGKNRGCLALLQVIPAVCMFKWFLYFISDRKQMPNDGTVYIGFLAKGAKTGWEYERVSDC